MARRRSGSLLGGLRGLPGAPREEEREEALQSTLLYCDFLLCPSLARYPPQPRLVLTPGTPKQVFAPFFFPWEQ